MKACHTQALSEACLTTIHLFGRLDGEGAFYLAGSAALALYLDHRPVQDLDLMSPVCRLRASERRDLLQELSRIDPSAHVETARDGFFHLRMQQGEVGLRLFYYPYPLVDPEQEVEFLSVASPVDLGLMKLAAIISRGTMRDFVDLYLLCQTTSLELLLSRSGEKFGHVGDFPLQALKGLADRSLVGDEPVPKLNKKLVWSDVERWLDREVRVLGRRHIGLR